jgi:hypothetical protein
MDTTERTTTTEKTSGEFFMRGPNELEVVVIMFVGLMIIAAAIAVIA